MITSSAAGLQVLLHHFVVASYIYFAPNGFDGQLNDSVTLTCSAERSGVNAVANEFASLTLLY